MTLKNDRLSEREAGMPESEARPKDDEARREPNLRIVYSSDAPRKVPPVARADQVPNPRPAQMPANREAMLDRTLQARIGGLLREVFGDVAEAPVPDRFVKLLEALEKKELSRE